MTKFKISLLFLFLALLIFTRFYNLAATARFSNDESGFLVRVHQIYQERKITLAGQVNEQGTKLFSSLTVYLLLPFAILGHFNPLSLFYGAAFWGVVTALSLFYLGYRVNPSRLWLIALLVLVWFPLVQTGRWAWNPNLIPLWISLGLICFLVNRSVFYLLAGICFGLSVHQHYYALFAIFAFCFLASLKFVFQKKYQNILFLGFGVFIALLPFLIFDLRHPPGIFLLGAGHQAQNIQSSPLVNFVNYSSLLFQNHTQSPVLATILIITVLLLLAYDLKNHRSSLIYFIPCLFQVIAISWTTIYYHHYFLSIIPFFFLWLLSPRPRLGQHLSLFNITVLVVSGVIALPSLLTVTPLEPSLANVNKITTIIGQQIQSMHLQSSNLVVLASPDPTTQGQKFRDLLLVSRGLRLDSVDQYPASSNLFVISTSSVAIVRSDPAYEIDKFRSGILKSDSPVDNTPWHVYLFSRSPND